jgi:D-sedoheptulose 7-phosphate isomerase
MSGVTGSHARPRASGSLPDSVVEAALSRRLEAGERFFEAEAGRIARLCRQMSERFAAGGRLFAVGGSRQAWSDAHHIAVEFVHPVIVGKRALPALAIQATELELLRRQRDLVASFEPFAVAADDDWTFEPPTDDPFVGQELVETLYHVLWELVHVFFEHGAGSTAGAGASAFLYPFLEQADGAMDAVEQDVAQSVLMKAAEVGELRRQTMREGSEALAAAAVALRRSFDEGGKVLTFGNGGSATDAMDLVADLTAAPQGWPSRPAINLSGDAAILTALANDIGPGALFQRQVIAYGAPGDVVVALSTSGNSHNVIEALAEARKRQLTTVAFVGYDGGRVAAEGLADHVVVTRSEHIPRIQEAQATAYHVLRELVEASR